LNWQLIAEMLTGLHALRVFLTRRKGEERIAVSKWPLVRGAVVHLLIIVAMVSLGGWPAALAWVGGVGVVFPFFATLRPLLEHRRAASDDALLSGDRDAVTRLFADGPFARIFGGAGFTRHMLHHWEPQVSYTRLAELEAYLARTSIGPILEARRTTYWRAFQDILASDRVR
jgi:fatty acid desaturase